MVITESKDLFSSEKNQKYKEGDRFRRKRDNNIGTSVIGQIRGKQVVRRRIFVERI